MPRLINWDLIANPLNWVSVFLMLFIVGMGVHLLANNVSLKGKI